MCNRMQPNQTGLGRSASIHSEPEYLSRIALTWNSDNKKKRIEDKAQSTNLCVRCLSKWQPANCGTANYKPAALAPSRPCTKPHEDHDATSAAMNGLPPLPALQGDLGPMLHCTPSGAKHDACRAKKHDHHPLGPPG